MYLIGYLSLLLGIIGIALAINIILEPKESYHEKYKLTKKMWDGYVEDERVENLLSYDTRTGELILTQQIKKGYLIKEEEK